jgi:Zn-dependent peptidase ImmA (M78 family)
MLTELQIKKTFGFRLAQARRMNGLSLRMLEARLDGLVTAAALNKYEQGRMLPGSEVLSALCRVFGQKADYFFRPTSISLGEVEFRKRTALGAKAEAAIKEAAGDFFERYLEIEELLGVGGQFENPLASVVIRQPEDIEKAALQLRRAWKLGLDALPGVVTLLEEKHIKIFETDAPESFDGFAGWAGDVPVIALNENFPNDRKRLTALHELGHLLLSFEGFTPKEIEKLCHRFAGAVLMPESEFLREFGGRRAQISKHELVELKERFGLSCGAIMMRAADLDLIAPGTLQRFFSLWRKWYGKKEPGQWGLPEKAERFETLVYRAASSGSISLSKAAYLLRKSQAEFEKNLEVVP